MIRIVGTRIIIPKGDTGFFYLIKKGAHSENDVAVFSVKGPLTRKTVIEKIEKVLEKEDLTRIGVIAGSGAGGFMSIEKNHAAMLQKGFNKCSPCTGPMLGSNMG